MSTASTASGSTEAPPERSRLQAYLAARHPGAETWITGFKPAPSGYSNETRFLTLHTRQDGRTTSRDLVVRWAPKGAQAQYVDYDISYQYKAMQALANTAVPVPALLLFETDPTIVGGPFFVMEKVAGDITSDYPPGYHGAGYLFEAAPAQRAHVWWRSLEVMAALHQVDWRLPAFDFMNRPADGREALQRQLSLYQRLLVRASSKPLPTIDRALKWLHANMPPAPSAALCWTDARPGNIIFRQYEPVAALDWEGLHIAAPENDLAYFILVDEVAYRALGQRRLEGLPDEAETIARYEQLIGRQVEAMDYYFVMQGTWLAIMMALSVRAALSKGIAGFPPDYASNNVSIQRLEHLLVKVA